MKDVRRDDIPDNSVSILGNSVVLSALALGGIRVTRTRMSDVELLEQAVKHAQDASRKEADETLFFNTVYNPDLDAPHLSEKFSFDVSDDRMYRPFTSLDDEYVEPTEDVVAFDKTKWERASGIEMSQDGSVDSRTSADLNRTGRDVEKSYKGILYTIEQSGVNVTDIRDMGDTFHIKIQDEVGAVDTIQLPKYQSGIIRKQGKTYAPKAMISIVNGQALYNSYGVTLVKNIHQSLEKVSPDNLRGAASHAQHVKNLVEMQSHRMYTELVPFNEIGALTGRKFFRSEIMDAAGKPFIPDNLKAVLESNLIYEGKPIVSIAPGKEGSSIVDTGLHASVRGVSEQSAVKGTIASEPAFGIGPYTPWIKQSQARMNWLAGRKLARKHTREEYAARLGFIPETTAAVLSKQYRETIPGKLANVGFYTGNFKGMADGAATFVIQRNGQNRYQNYDAFAGSRKTPYTLLGPTESMTISKFTDSIYQKLIDNPETGVYINKGDIIGVDPANGKPKRAAETGWVRSGGIFIDGNIVHLDIESDRVLAPGYKFAQSKAVTESIITTADLETQFAGGNRIIGKVLGAVTGEQGIDIMMGMKQRGKFAGGMFDLGILQKVLSDVIELKRREYFSNKEALRDSELLNKFKKEMVQVSDSIITSQLGADAAGKLNISITDDLDIAVLLKGTTTTADPVFGRLMTFETAIERAEQTGDWRDFSVLCEQYEKTVQKVSGVKSFKLSVSTDMLANLMKGPDFHTLPAFIMNSDQNGQKGGLTGVMIRTLMTGHEVNSYSLSKIARFDQTRRGYVGGAKITGELRRNYSMMKLPHLVRYLDSIRDVNMTYILDKYKSAETRLLSTKNHTPGSSFIKIGDRKLNVRATGIGGDLLSRLATMAEQEETLNAYIGFRHVAEDISNITGLVDSELTDSFLRGQLLSIGDLKKIGAVGSAGNSLGIVSEDIMRDLISMTNAKGPGESVYLKLPFEISMGMTTGDMVPLINFDKDDMFKLMAVGDVSGSSVDRTIKNRYYTMSAYGREQVFYMQKVAEIQHELATKDVSATRKAELKRNLETATDHFYRQLGKAFSSKMSSAKEALMERRAPLSMQLEVKSAYDIPLDAIGVTKDTMTKMLTGGNVHSYREAMDYVNSRGIIEKFTMLTDNQIAALISLEKGASGDLIDFAADPANTKNPVNRFINTYLSESTSEHYVNRIKGAVDRLSGETDQHMVSSRLKTIQSVMKSMLRDADTRNFDHLRAHEVITRMQDNTLALIAEVNRFPINDPAANATLRYMIYEPNMFSTRAIKDLGEGYVKKAAEQSGDFAYYHPATAAGHRADFDRDFTQLITLSLETLDTVDRELMKQLGISSNTGVLGSLRLNRKQIHGATADAIDALIQRRIAVKTPGLGHGLMPAASTAYKTMFALDEEEYLGHIGTTNLEGYLDQVLEKTLPGDIRSKQRERIRQKILSKRKQEAFEIHGEHLELRVVNAMDDITGIERKSVLKEPKYNELIRKYPEQIQNAIRGLSEDQQLIVNELSNIGKEDFIAYHRDVMRRQIDRFGEMKLDTPKAYKIGTAIQTLAEHAAANASDRAFLMYYGGEVISQNTISLKHGTPSFIKNLTSLLKSFENTNSSILHTIKDFEDIQNAGYALEFSRAEREEMLSWGMIDKLDEHVEFDVFEEYLEKRKQAFSTVMEIHNEAQVKSIERVKSGMTDTAALKAEYRNYIDSKMSSLDVLGTTSKGKQLKFQMTGDMYHRDLVYDALTRSETAVKNMRKHREKAKMSDAVFSRTYDNTRELVRQLKMRKETEDVSLFNDPLYNALFGFEEGDYSVVDEIADHGKRLAENNSVRVNSWYGTMVGRLSAWIHGKKNASAVNAGTQERKEAFERLQTREKRVLFSRQKERLEAGETVFRRGSVFEHLAGRPTTPLPDTTAEIHIRGSRKRLGAGIFGLIAGTIAGQLFSSATTGYAVPGLKNTEGLGGEYYEERNGIMGREMEMFLEPQKPKVVPWYRESAGLNHGSGDLRAVSGALRYSPERGRKESSFQGVIVR